jgi:hypothetical protein
MDDKYIDGIGQVSVQGATVRMELTGFSSLKAEEGKLPEQAVVGRVSMSLRTLISLQKTTEEVVNQLVEKGVLKRKDTTTSDGEPSIEPSDDDGTKH